MVISITSILFVVGIVLIFALFAEVVTSLRKCNKDAIKKMPFRESLDLANLPILTFSIGEQKYNFLLDTGASNSAINKSVLGEIVHKSCERKDYVYGMEGNKVVSEYVTMDILYKDTPFAEEFLVVDLDLTFGNIKKDFGVNLHGVLGNSFFKKYRCVIDFDKLVAYPT